MKQLLSIILLLFAAHSLRAVDYTCHTQAGQLQSLIGVPSSTITQLTVSGTLDARDFAYIGDSLTQLTSIDLTDCTIAAFESRDTYLANQSRFEANSLPAHTFIGFQNLTTVKLPRQTQTIGEAAFAGCPALTTVAWGDRLQTIGDLAFSGCTALNTPLPATLQTIGEYGLAQCAYTRLDLSGTALRTIGANAFGNCTRLTEIALPASLQTLGERGFAGCSALTAIALPGSLQSLGEGCFAHCTAMTRAEFATHALDTLPAYTFDHCTALASIQVPDAVTHIGEGAFYYCTALTGCTLPDGVRSIGDYAFAGCSRMIHLTFLPEGLEQIGRWPFYGMRQLYSVSIPSTVTYIGDHAFDNCTRLAAVLAYPALPPSLGEEVFREVPQANCALGVPDESIELYSGTPQWQEFDIRLLSNKEELTTDNRLNVHFEQGNLIVQSSAPMRHIALYTPDGRLVYRESGEATEWTIDTQSYPGQIFILSVQMASGEYHHLKMGRN